MRPDATGHGEKNPRTDLIGGIFAFYLKVQWTPSRCRPAIECRKKSIIDAMPL